jgi:hypothetical protein
MWREPYLETCCRSALHRVVLAGSSGRPAGLSDGPCLNRLCGMGLTSLQADGRYHLTQQGAARHDSEILHAAYRHR